MPDPTPAPSPGGATPEEVEALAEVLAPIAASFFGRGAPTVEDRRRGVFLAVAAIDHFAAAAVPGPPEEPVEGRVLLAGEWWMVTVENGMLSRQRVAAAPAATEGEGGDCMTVYQDDDGPFHTCGLALGHTGPCGPVPTRAETCGKAAGRGHFVPACILPPGHDGRCEGACLALSVLGGACPLPKNHDGPHLAVAAGELG